jgi:hypothetical protein
VVEERGGRGGQLAAIRRRMGEWGGITSDPSLRCSGVAGPESTLQKLGGHSGVGRAECIDQRGQRRAVDARV